MACPGKVWEFSCNNTGSISTFSWVDIDAVNINIPTVQTSIVKLP